MATNPDATCRAYLDAGADVLTFHLEAATHALRIVDEIHQAGRRAGVAINPGTPVSMLESLIDDLDLVLVMSVNPGFGGQAFIHNTYRKLRQVKRLCADHRVSPIIEVDGGITADNAERVVSAGANMLVAGSSVFKAADREAAIADIRRAGNRGFGGRC
jgi:ribulose-phosphate 3-epimerase